jgi:hypothetical protein
MFKQWLGMHGSDLPFYAMTLFIAISALVAIYIATDRRGEHRKRMERMPLRDEEQDHG